ncbi:hypothetical protein SAMN02910358_00716 [Lachnospiraceae bacterium XBB1006]|nr:hypothetical protein SAMN02910358_00716 [Lachnospiraceae bacterium XBB1006]
MGDYIGCLFIWNTFVIFYNTIAVCMVLGGRYVLGGFLWVLFLFYTLLGFGYASIESPIEHKCTVKECEEMTGILEKYCYDHQRILIMSMMMTMSTTMMRCESFTRITKTKKSFMKIIRTRTGKGIEFPSWLCE